MPDDQDDIHFEEWRNHYFKESIKGNSNLLIDLLNKVRERDLDASQKKFVEDNFRIQGMRQISNMMQASKDIRKAINEHLDHNHPATSIVKHIDDALQKQRLLVDSLIKMSGYFGMKGDLHRKYLAALMGAVQVGSGASTEDIILNDHNLSVALSTRMAAEFGRFDLGTWSLRAGEPARFLSDPELKRMNHGSPEEREVLRHRIIVESIVARFHKRGFIFTVIGDDGTVSNIGWDIGSCLKSGYVQGKLRLKTKHTDSSEVMFDPKGGAVPILDIEIRYVKETGEIDENGEQRKHDVPFIERKDGMLFLVAPSNVLREAATGLQGLIVKEVPYQGNPSDLKILTRCVYSAAELIMRQC
jgi:hypothetical protein